MWFHFGVRRVNKPAFIKLSIVNLTPMKCLYTPKYRPICRFLPLVPNWHALPSEIQYENIGEKCARLTWTFDVTQGVDEEFYFAFSYPYPYAQVARSIDNLQTRLPENTYFYREVLARSLENRDVELITISDHSNLSGERESRMMGLFPTYTPRCHK